MKQHITLFVGLLFWVTSFAQNDEQVIRRSFDEQIKAWNNGDINGFMQTYWQSDSLMFIGKTGVTYGWENTRQNYLKGYPDTAAMGKLSFELIQMKRLSVLYYSVVGKWHLSRSIGNLSGHFTLLLRKINNKWVIISDHSS